MNRHDSRVPGTVADTVKRRRSFQPPLRGRADVTRQTRRRAQPGAGRATFTIPINRAESTGEVIPLFDPRHERWDDHYRVETDDGTIQGVTPTGRVTVACL